MQELSINTQKMYTHPFTVSNAVSNIQTGIITMHRNMKDIVLSRHSLEIVKTVEAVQHEEDEVLKNFELIYKYYLGNKKDIDDSFNAFLAWKSIREKVIVNVYENKLEEAIAITKGEGATHIKKLYKKIDVLKSFAFSKANQFYVKSVKDNGVDHVITVIIIAILISFFIVVYIINTLFQVNKANNKQLYLIDQNILMARISLNKEVVEISNALCRTLGIQKDEILNKKSEYFFTDKTQFELFEKIIYSAKEYNAEVHITINNVKTWFNIEVFPELDNNFNILSFNIILTNISDKKRIEKIAIVDTLTNLHNRNYFETIFDKELKRAKRDKKGLSMIMLDVDYFKQFNDTYGHQDGDRALKSVAQVIENHTNRSYDHAFRVGGEEFIILSYHEDMQSLSTFAQSIIDDIHKEKIPHKSSKISDFLTISAGVALFDKMHLLNTDEMYKAVDDLLYKAKKEGRNRIVTKAIG